MDRFAFVAATSPLDAPDMPAGTRVRYFAPAPALAPFATGYNCYGAVAEAPRADPFLPMMAMVNVLIDAGPVAVTIGRHRFDPVPQVALYGSMTRPIHAQTRGGLMIGAGISPLGWGRLASRRSAADFHNRVVPVGAMFGTGWGERLAAALAGAGTDMEIPAILDRHLAPLFGTPHPQEALIAAFGAIVVEDGAPDIATAAERLGISTAALRRLSLRFFGLPPKPLLRRARFLRSFLRETGLDGAGRTGEIDKSYFDRSHYLRDANDFLGTTPRRFLSAPADFLRGSAVARLRTLGIPFQALQHVDPASPAVHEG